MRARRVGFDQEVGALDQTAQHRLALGGVEIERDAALVAVVGPPVERALRVRPSSANGPMRRAGEPPGGSTFDHVGAEIAEDLAAQQAALVGQVEDAIGAQHGRSIPAARTSPCGGVSKVDGGGCERPTPEA